MTKPEWIGQILLISLLRYKTTFYKVLQENNSAIVSSVGGLQQKSTSHLQAKKRALFAEGCFTFICYLLDICNRLARHFSLGMQAKFSKQIFKIFALAAVHTDAFWNRTAVTKNAGIQIGVFKSLFSLSKPVR